MEHVDGRIFLVKGMKSAFTKVLDINMILVCTLSHQHSQRILFDSRKSELSTLNEKIRMIAILCSICTNKGLTRKALLITANIRENFKTMTDAV